MKLMAKGPCTCKNRKRGYTYAELTQHMNGSNNWLHRMLGFYMHFLYDNYDENNMKCIVLDPVDQQKRETCHEKISSKQVSCICKYFKMKVKFLTLTIYKM